MANDETAPDGRRLRSERSRIAVVDAMLSYYDEGISTPTAVEIAQRAGVSERSVFRHFDDLESIAAEAVDRQMARVAEYFEAPSAEGSRTERITALVDARCRLYERMANLARTVNRLAATSPTIAAVADERRIRLRRQVAIQFEPELDALDDDGRRLALAALDAATSLEHLDYLRMVGGLSADELRVVLAHQLVSGLDALDP